MKIYTTVVAIHGKDGAVLVTPMVANQSAEKAQALATTRTEAVERLLGAKLVTDDGDTGLTLRHVLVDLGIQSMSHGVSVSECAEENLIEIPQFKPRIV